MIKRPITTAMELLLRVSLCLLMFIGKSLGDEIHVVTVAVLQSTQAILPCSPTTKEDLSFKVFMWRKDGQKDVFHYDAGNHYNNGLQGQDAQFKGRVSFFQDQLRYGNASIVIQNVTAKDTGIYSCEFPDLQSRSQTFKIKLGIKLFATEDTDVIFPCSPKEKDDLTQQLFDWKKDEMQEVFFYDNDNHYNNGKTGQNENFKNRVDFFKDQLQAGNASIRIKNTKLTDGGIYSCAFPHLQPPGQKFYIELVVGCILKDRTSEIQGVCPKPTLSIENTADGVMVNCSVPGVSKVEMELHNSDDGTVYKPVDAGTSQNSQYFMFSVTKKGYYCCLVKQNEYCHQIYSVKNFVQISELKNGTGVQQTDFSKTTVVLAVALAVALVALGVVCLLYKKKQPGNRTKDVASSEDKQRNLNAQEEVSQLTNDA